VGHRLEGNHDLQKLHDYRRTDAGSAPKELYNKSIILRWTENRTQRFEYVNRIVNSGVAAMVSIYISGAGNTFIRIHRSAYGGRNVSGCSPDQC
jgi:hypothetical protein